MLNVKIISNILLVLVTVVLNSLFRSPNIEKKENILKIPSIDLNIPIIEGYSYANLEDFVVVNFYNAITENVVVYGHRFTFKQLTNAPFFKLDNLKIGDSIFLTWNDHIYKYLVENIVIIRPEEKWFLSRSVYPKISLVTCAPVYNPINRLVIIGRLVSID